MGSWWLSTLNVFESGEKWINCKIIICTCTRTHIHIYIHKYSYMYIYIYPCHMFLIYSYWSTIYIHINSLRFQMLWCGHRFRWFPLPSSDYFAGPAAQSVAQGTENLGGTLTCGCSDNAAAKAASKAEERWWCRGCKECKVIQDAGWFGEDHGQIPAHRRDLQVVF